jgi:hypothetical protein
MSGSVLTTINELLEKRPGGRNNEGMVPNAALKLKNHIKGKDDTAILV